MTLFHGGYSDRLGFFFFFFLILAHLGHFVSTYLLVFNSHKVFLFGWTILFYQILIEIVSSIAVRKKAKMRVLCSLATLKNSLLREFPGGSGRHTCFQPDQQPGEDGMCIDMIPGPWK